MQKFDSENTYLYKKSLEVFSLENQPNPVFHKDK